MKKITIILPLIDKLDNNYSYINLYYNLFEQYLTNSFGGSTKYIVEGSYKSSAHNNIIEKNIKYEVVLKSFKYHQEELITQITFLHTILKSGGYPQESIYLDSSPCELLLIPPKEDSFLESSTKISK